MLQSIALMMTPAPRSRTSLISVIVLLLLAQNSHAQNRFKEDTKHFDYDSQSPLDVHELSVRTENGIVIHDLTYRSPKGGNVPAYLVVPKMNGKLAAILWGHWMMPGSAMDNRQEFLQEAIAIAPSGVVSLLIDDPQARIGSQDTSDRAMFAQQVVDLRRGMDLLTSRPDVDPKRIAYVGHSYDSEAGAVLDAIDKRFAAFVLMGGPGWNSDLTDSSDAWDDPSSYANHFGPAPVLFQCGLHDKWDPVSEAKKYFQKSSGPKKIRFYDSGHALNAEARHDRFAFLREHLKLGSLPTGALDSVPQTK